MSNTEKRTYYSASSSFPRSKSSLLWSSTCVSRLECAKHMRFNLCHVIIGAYQPRCNISLAYAVFLLASSERCSGYEERQLLLVLACRRQCCGLMVGQKGSCGFHYSKTCLNSCVIQSCSNSFGRSSEQLLAPYSVDPNLSMSRYQMDSA